MQHCGRQGVRNLWGMINFVFNKVDYSRIKELGPDQAAAEWLVRCGAVVKFKNMDKWSTDYNCLPRGTSGQFFIEEVDATDSSIMHVGFDYFIGVNHLRSLKLHHCTYLKNTCLGRLDILKDSLEELQLSSCGDVTDAGVVSLHKLINLKHLFLCDLPGIKDMDSILKTLGTALPQCEIRYLSLEGNKDLKKLGIDKESFR
ncbi:ATP synthase subunit s, mitochondrial-like [Asterias amurensis]|uniref:ATP synthase subunit s, mitochondrial-like n=1 Tax=Asterias amurensis TaxID=7602 RepID=UPI003AB29970